VEHFVNPTVLKDLPQKNNIVLYTEAFDTSRLQSGVSWQADIPSDGSKNLSIAFTGDLNIANGVSMNGTFLTGPKSDTFTTLPDGSLASFSVCFFGKINNLTGLDGPTKTTKVFKLFAETPHVVEVIFTGVDANSVTVSMTVGTQTASWVVAKSTLASGQNNLYSFVYNASLSIFTFYLNTITPLTYTGTTPAPKIILGNTEMTINKNVSAATGIAYLDMNLYAFVYYAVPLTTTDQSALLDYFTQESNGISQYVRAQASAQSALDKARTDFQSNLDVCQSSLSVCKSSLKIAEVSKVMQNPWQIKLDDKYRAPAALAEMYKNANPFHVQRFGDGSVATAATAAPDPPGSASASPSPSNVAPSPSNVTPVSLPGRLVIKYPF
jgi:hypothetical protein